MNPVIFLLAVICTTCCAQAVETASVKDPTLPTRSLADGLTHRLADAAALKLHALVVGASGEGVALVGTTPQAAVLVRRGSVLAGQVGDVRVEAPVASVTAEGVALAASSGAPGTRLRGSYLPLAAPTNPPPEFLAYFECAGVPIDRVARLVADQAGVNVSVSDATAGKTVSLLLRNVTADAAIEEICRASGFWFRREPKGNVIRITTMAEYTDNLASFREEETETFTLLYPNVVEVASVIYGLYPDRTMLSLGEEEFQEDDEYDLSRRFRRFRAIEENGNSQFMNMQPTLATGTGEQGGAGDFSFVRGNMFSRLTQWDQVRDRRRRTAGFADRAALSAAEAGSMERAYRAGDTNRFDRALGRSALGAANIFVTMSRKNNMLVVRTSDREVMDQVRAMVRKLDVPTPMVLLELKVMELDITDDYEAGFSWGLTDLDGGKRVAGMSTHALGHTVANGSTGLKEANLLANMSQEGLQRSSPTFAFTVLSDRIASSIEMMQKDGRTKILATPTLLTANNEVSRIFDGKEYPVVTGWTKGETVVSENSTLHYEATANVELKDVGTMLLITPNINSDKTVTLRLMQENSDISPDKARVPVGGDEREVEFVVSRSLTGTFVAKDGVTVVAGGLVREAEEDVHWRTPVLGSLPYLGWLFRGTSKEKRRTELVVLIKPHVISTPYEGGKISQDLMKLLSAHPARDGRTNMGVFIGKDKVPSREHNLKDDVLNIVK